MRLLLLRHRPITHATVGFLAFMVLLTGEEFAVASASDTPYAVSPPEMASVLAKILRDGLHCVAEESMTAGASYRTNAIASCEIVSKVAIVFELASNAL